VENLSDLSLFCLLLVKECASPDTLSEEEKAEEFRKVYLRNLPLSVTTIMAAARACGINLVAVSASKMPRNMRGYHEMIVDGMIIDSRKTIYYREDDTASGLENTILHEMREMMERIFPEVCPGYRPLRTLATHLAANRFATAVLLPRESFESKMYETGLDVVALANFYQKSCSQVLLRMGRCFRAGSSSTERSMSLDSMLNRNGGSPTGRGAGMRSCLRLTYTELKACFPGKDIR